MAMEYVVQRLEIGDVVLIDLPAQGGEVEAKVVRAIDRTDRTVRVSLRVERREDFVKEGLRMRGSPLYAVLEAPGPLSLPRERVELRSGSR
jgi:hypothetical protein